MTTINDRVKAKAQRWYERGQRIRRRRHQRAYLIYRIKAIAPYVILTAIAGLTIHMGVGLLGKAAIAQQTERNEQWQRYQESFIFDK
jgi:hypothetical protein